MNDTPMANGFQLGDRKVNRLGYGAMQLAGPHVFGPPKDRAAALGVLRAAVEAGVNHIDTSDFYGPHITNQLIREALSPYKDDLTIVTKVGAVRDDKGAWLPAASAEALTSAVHDNLRNLGLDRLEVVNFRAMFDMFGPAEGSIEEPLTVLAGLQQQGLVRHIGMSNVTARQVASVKWCACRTSTTWSTEVMTRWSTAWRKRVLPTCRFFRSEDSAHSNRRVCQRWPNVLVPPRCRWHLPGS